MPQINKALRDRAREVLIEDEIARRAIGLRGNGAERTGPCPRCGGDDRFSINTAKQVFNCRHCGVGGDVIALVQHLDGVDFHAACRTLAGDPGAIKPKVNGKGHASTVAQESTVAEFPYHDEAGTVVFATERIEFWNPDVSRSQGRQAQKIVPAEATRFRPAGRVDLQRRRLPRPTLPIAAVD